MEYSYGVGSATHILSRGEVISILALFSLDDKVKEIVQKNEAQIKSEVMADEITYDKAAGFTKEWSINGEKVTLGVEKLS